MTGKFCLKIEYRENSEQKNIGEKNEITQNNYPYESIAFNFNSLRYNVICQ